MKKILISLTGLLMLGFVAVLFINARGNPEDIKAKTEVNTDVAKGPATMGCGACPGMAAAACSKAETKATESTAAKCTNPDCTDPNCKGECKMAGSETKACNPSACPGMQKK